MALCLERSSHGRQTLPKRISNDSQRIFRRQPKIFWKIFELKILFFAKKARFWATHGRMDLKISLRVKFCSRNTFPEVCTTKNRGKKDYRRDDDVDLILTIRILTVP